MGNWTEILMHLPDEDAAVLRFMLLEKMGFRQAGANLLVRDSDEATVSYGPGQPLRLYGHQSVEDPILD